MLAKGVETGMLAGEAYGELMDGWEEVGTKVWEIAAVCLWTLAICALGTALLIEQLGTGCRKQHPHQAPYTVLLTKVTERLLEVLGRNTWAWVLPIAPVIRWEDAELLLDEGQKERGSWIRAGVGIFIVFGLVGVVAVACGCIKEKI